jgi:membrane protein
MLSYFEVSIGWGELLKRTSRETLADNGLGLAAQLSYYFFFSLFPALLVGIALAGFLPSQDLVGSVVAMFGGILPAEVIQIIQAQLTKIGQADQGGILTFGMAAAIWSSSAAMVALIDALNRAYDVEDARPWWKQRLIAVLLTIGVAVFILVSFALVVAGPQLAEFVARLTGLGGLLEWTWKIAQWPLVVALVAAAFAFIYYFAPDVDQDFVWLTPGSLLAALLWLASSLVFRVYVVNFGSYIETYGAIGGVMVLLLWLYLSGLAVVIGAELNAEIEHASPHGKAEGEKVPGERKTVGSKAARLFRARHGRPPVPDEAPRPIATPAYPRGPSSARTE